MKTLKSLRLLSAALMLLAAGSNASAQNFSETKDAFQDSYIQEATGEFLAAISSLKAVYDEGSYELNLRLGWLSYQAGSFTDALAY